MDNMHNLYDLVKIYTGTVKILFLLDRTHSHKQCYWFAEDHDRFPVKSNPLTGEMNGLIGIVILAEISAVGSYGWLTTRHLSSSY